MTKQYHLRVHDDLHDKLLRLKEIAYPHLNLNSLISELLSKKIDQEMVAILQTEVVRKKFLSQEK